MKHVLNLSALGNRFRENGWYYSVLAALPAAVVAYLIGLLLEKPSGQASSYDLYTYATVACAFVVAGILLLFKRISLNTTIYTILTLICCQFSGKLIFLLYFNPNPQLFHAELTETFFWIPAVYILGTFMPGLKWGRAIALGFFAVASLAGVSYIVVQPWQGYHVGVKYALLELGLANSTLLILTHVFMNFKTATAEQRYRAEVMERLAYTDSLTQLPNRLALEETLEQVLRERRRSESVGVFFLDLDGFKAINDSYGHAVGDELLQVAARRLQRLSREDTLAFRISGDEFVVIVPQLRLASEAREVGARIGAALETPVALGERVVTVSASVGLALCPDDGTDVETLLRHADTAMYGVKANGKNGVQRFCATATAELEDRAGLAQGLKRALFNPENAEENLSLAYQPIFDARTGQISKVEALLRWQSDKHGQVPPGVFIPVAEESGLINALGQWVLHTACQQASAWQTGDADLKVCVNVSAHQFVQSDFVATVEAALVASKLPPGCLELELTESVVIYAFDRVLTCLRELRRLGVSIALDDFGTGYSSLAYLEELDFDTIKLDRSFADKVVRTRRNPHYPLALVRAVAEIADTLGVQVVAEGIETEEQLELLRSLGCTLMQGFLLARPMSAKALSELLATPQPPTANRPAALT